MLDYYLVKLHGKHLQNVFDIEDLTSGGLLWRNELYHIKWTHLSGAMSRRKHYWEIGLSESKGLFSHPWIFLVRDFESTLKSAYFHATERNGTFQGTPSAFIRDSRFGIAKLVSFYNYIESVRSRTPAFHLFSYENFLENTELEFRRLVSILQLELSDSLIDEALEAGSFENMQALSLTPAYAKSIIAPVDPGRSQTYKVREGKGREHFFSDEDREYIRRVVTDLFIGMDSEEYRACLESVRKH
jgi:hypothetical protein